MKSDPSFPKLPSIGELLKHPTVEQIVDRVNQTTIAQRATGFLEELQSSFQGRSDRGVVPSIHQLAERLARRLLGPDESGIPVINATGAVLGDRWPAPPLAEAAVHEMLRFASEYHEDDQQLSKQIASRLVEITGAEAAWVAGSFSGAAYLVEITGEDAQVDTLGYVGLIDPAEYGLSHVDTICDRLATGADLVLVEGAGLLGGPQCGIVLGSRKQVAKLCEHSFAEAAAADRLTLVALDATLRIYQLDKQAIHQIPVLQLLSAPVANLQQRCERLAPLLEACEEVATATPMQCESIWYDTSATKISGPSWAIRLQPAEATVQELSHRLQGAAARVVAREQQDAVWLDLRSVFPRWDQQLVAAFES